MTRPWVSRSDWVGKWMEEDPHCWFCSRLLVRPEGPTPSRQDLPPDWPTFDHLVSILNGDVPPETRRQLGGVLACNECNQERGRISWLLSRCGLRRNLGAPFPLKPSASGHVWEWTGEPGTFLEHVCARCGLRGERDHRHHAWRWRGARDQDWQTGLVRTCDDERNGTSLEGEGDSGRIVTGQARERAAALAAFRAAEAASLAAGRASKRTRRTAERRNRNRHHWPPGEQDAVLRRHCPDCGIEMKRLHGREPWTRWRLPGRTGWRNGGVPTCHQVRVGELPC